ncbi:MAG: hypothetical protein IPN34_04865 [Planctomycetes bacterium]|nr:hypothetical protein [Planctomycetota bacterium]
MGAAALSVLRTIRGVVAAIAILASRGEAQTPHALTVERAAELLSAWSSAATSAARESALHELMGGLDTPHLAVLLERWPTLPLQDGSEALFWRRLVGSRPDLVAWIHEAWLVRRIASAREGAIALVSAALEGGTQLQEDLRPLIALFPAELWAREPSGSLQELARDLAFLGGAKVPLLIDPSAAALASEPRASISASAPRGLRGDQLLREAAALRSLGVWTYPGALWITAIAEERRPAPVDLAERLLAAAESDELEIRRAAFEALGALGVPGWYAWCEERALQPGADPALEGSLFGAGPRGLEPAIEPRLLDAYLPSGLTRSANLRARFRSLWRRCLQAPLSAPMLERLAALSEERTVRGELAWRLQAWRRPEIEVERLREILREGASDDAVFAWRGLLRAGSSAPNAELVEALRRHPGDARLHELLLATLEARGLPAPVDREDFSSLRAAVEAAPELRDLTLELDLRSNEPERVTRALNALLALPAQDPRAISVAARLAASFARMDPERRIQGGPRALVFRRLEGIRAAGAGQKQAAAAFAHRMGWILVDEQLLRSEGVDPIPPPRLLDLDPYEGGGGR